MYLISFAIFSYYQIFLQIHTQIFIQFKKFFPALKKILKVSLNGHWGNIVESMIIAGPNYIH